MTESQKMQIEEIKKEWIHEVEQLPPINLSPNCLNNNANQPRLEIEKKYKEKIRQVMEKE